MHHGKQASERRGVLIAFIILDNPAASLLDMRTVSFVDGKPTFAQVPVAVLASQLSLATFPDDLGAEKVPCLVYCCACPLHPSWTATPHVCTRACLYGAHLKMLLPTFVILCVASST